MTVRYHVKVSGRVQGVWYRESCRQEATAAGVAGWVRNAEDGDVEAILEGEPGPVDRVLRWMWVGPPLALVANVDATEEAPRDERGFRVR